MGNDDVGSSVKPLRIRVGEPPDWVVSGGQGRSAALRISQFGAGSGRIPIASVMEVPQDIVSAWGLLLAVRPETALCIRIGAETGAYALTELAEKSVFVHNRRSRRRAISCEPRRFDRPTHQVKEERTTHG